MYCNPRPLLWDFFFACLFDILQSHMKAQWRQYSALTKKKKQNKILQQQQKTLHIVLHIIYYNMLVSK